MMRLAHLKDRGNLFSVSILIPLIGLASLALSSVVLAQTPVPNTSAPAPRLAPTAQQMADYKQKLAEYNAAQQKFKEQADPYWASIKAKRASRNAKRAAHQAIVLEDYVLTQPPEYSGPGKPVDPSLVAAETTARGVPVVADFLTNAGEQFLSYPKSRRPKLSSRRLMQA